MPGATKLPWLIAGLLVAALAPAPPPAIVRPFGDLIKFVLFAWAIVITLFALLSFPFILFIFWLRRKLMGSE
jgi:hypothetical protein